MSSASTPRPPARSLLFVPGHQPARFDKACASGADAVVLDLEDAVPPDRKDEARAQVGEWLAARRDGAAAPVIGVRINAADTPWHAADVDLCARAGSAAAMHVQRLVFGSIDFQADLDIEADDEGDGDELLFYRSQIVLASRLAGLQAPVDGVSTAIDQGSRLEAEARRARALGFGAKLCIHPKQVAAVNQGFSPVAERVAWAKRVLAADAASGGAPVAVDGKMVDRPVVLKAQAVLRAASR